MPTVNFILLHCIGHIDEGILENVEFVKRAYAPTDVKHSTFSIEKHSCLRQLLASQHIYTLVSKQN